MAPKIAILGAGPSGLLLARLLHLYISPTPGTLTLFESDPSASHRTQGGTLDLHTATGQAALQAAGLYNAFLSHARPEAEALRLIRFDGSVVWDENGPDKRVESGGRPEIDREKLRELLLESLPEGMVQWGRKVERVESSGEEGKWDVVFADGTRHDRFDLVVGADGAWSRVRPLLTDVVPFYSGITSVELWCLKAEERDPFITKFVGRGSMFMFDEGRAIQAQRLGSGDVRTYANVRVEKGWLDSCGIDWTSEEARSELTEKYFGDCGDDLKRLIKESRDEIVTRELFMLPVGVTWEPKRGITVMGDAAHLMTPFAGVGVNVALGDALELATALKRAKEKWEGENLTGAIAEAIKDYEASMFERGKANAEKTARNMRGHFSAGGVDHMLGRLRGSRA